MYRQTLLFAIVVLIASGCGSSNLKDTSDFQLRAGDLLFQDLDCGELCDAIEKVTNGFGGYNFSHVGVVAEDEKRNIVIIEAVSDGVVVTELTEFLGRSADENGQPKVVVGRLKKPYQRLIKTALGYALSLRGKPYDKEFAVNNGAYYCSELVYEIFLRAADQKPIFELQPMTFKDPATDEVLNVWQKYFDELGVPVPQGQPGINPGGISRSSVINIIYAYGKPSKHSG